MSKDTEKMRRTAAAEMQKNFEEVITENPMSIETASKSTSLFFCDVDYVKVWNKKLGDMLDDGRTVLTPKQRQVFIQHLNIQYSKLITEKMDPLTRVFVRSYNTNDRSISWFLDFPACLLRNFKDVGVYGCIDGVPRSGKTSVACLFMPIFNDKLNLQVITNIAINNPPEYIHQAKTLYDVVMLMHKLDSWVLILDETATYVDRKRALSSSNIDFENLGRFVGKMGGRLIMITHSYDRDIPPRLQEWMTERYTKQSKKWMKVVLTGRHYKAFDYIKDIPDAELEFVTEDITSLEFNLPIDKLLEKVQDGTPVNIAADMLVERKAETTHDKVIQLHKEHPDWTQTQIAKVIGVSQNTIKYHLNKD